MSDKPNGAEGHRARLRQRLLDGGGDALLDHELVEYLLTLAVPRRDTKPLAKRLISDAGGLGRLLEKPPIRKWTIRPCRTGRPATPATRP